MTARQNVINQQAAVGTCLSQEISKAEEDNRKM